MQIAKIGEEDLQAIRELEKALGGRVCLIATERAEALYVLEAKMAPNVWQRVDEAYSMEDLKAHFLSKEDALAAKASLKSLLNGPLGREFQKRPIRVRRVE